MFPAAKGEIPIGGRVISVFPQDGILSPLQLVNELIDEMK